MAHKDCAGRFMMGKCSVSKLYGKEILARRCFLAIFDATTQSYGL